MRKCATSSSSASAASRCRYPGEDQNWFRGELAGFVICRWRNRWHWSHDHLIEPRNLQCRPRQGSQTTVCALEEAEPRLIQYTGVIRPWHTNVDLALAEQDQGEVERGALECASTGRWEGRIECSRRTDLGGEEV